MAWKVVAQYGTGRSATYQKPTRTEARVLKKRLERTARLSGVPYDVRIKR